MKKAGLVLPGLGHLLSGDAINGVGLMLYVGLLAWSAIAGFPRLPELLFPPPEAGGFQLHPWVALASWILIAVGCWHTAFRLHQPAPFDPEVDKNSQWREIKKQFRRNRTGVFGLHFVNVLVFLALLTPFIAPFDPDAIDVGPSLAAPHWAHLMGTDEFGRDLFSRVMYGARISLSIGFIAVAISATLGTLIGSIAGYFGGKVDGGLMWVVDLLLSLPRLVLLLAIVGFFRSAGAQSIFLIVVILGLTGWMGVSRIVRSQILSLKEQDFVQACRALGLPNWRIILVHLVPNALAPVIVHASLAIGATILVEAALSFLGLGVPPPTSTWGAIVNDGREYMRSGAWITVFPGLMIVAAVMSFNLLGDGLRDALDPKLRGRH
ncbi:MAG TPA: ABC transporter permease [Myxococcota bacterium]|nr:ABC transporter permease [Myxococcota bacterium]